jgi:glutaredoxin 3
MKTVEIYSTPTCHFCQMAKAFLGEKGVAYTDYNVAEDAAKREEMLTLSEGQTSVPFIVLTDESGEKETMLGFDEGKLSEMLGL